MYIMLLLCVCVCVCVCVSALWNTASHHGTELVLNEKQNENRSQLHK
jgi:hypothetical protein